MLRNTLVPSTTSLGLLAVLSLWSFTSRMGFQETCFPDSVFLGMQSHDSKLWRLVNRSLLQFANPFLAKAAEQ